MNVGMEETPGSGGYSPFRIACRRFFRDRMAAAGFFFILFLFLTAAHGWSMRAMKKWDLAENTRDME